MGETLEPPDEELVRRSRSGDEAAARLLFERHRPALRARARTRLPAPLRGKVGESDVIQEAYLGAFLALGEFEDRGDGSFAAWLRAIVDRRIADEVRRHAGSKKRDVRREVRLATDAARLVPAPCQISPSIEAVETERSVLLRTTVAALPPDYATVIRLVHEEGLTLVAAGARMGRSPNAMRKLYGRALAQLAERLADDEGDPR